MHKQIVLTLLALFLIGCGGTMTQSDVVKHFYEELAKHNLKVDGVDQEGLYHISHNGLKIAISLENVTLNSIRDKTFSPIGTLVETIVSAGAKPASFTEIEDIVLPSLESNRAVVGNAISESLTKQIDIRYVIEKGNQLLYVDSDDLKKWNLSLDELKSRARINLDELFRKTKVVTSEVGGHSLYYFETDSPLKSTLLYSNVFLLEFQKKLGGQFFAVLPARDFCYFFSKNDKDYFFSRLGSTVKKEFSESGYGISEEILGLGDSGLVAVGSY